MKLDRLAGPIDPVGVGLKVIKGLSPKAQQNRNAGDLRQFGVRQAKHELSNQRGRRSLFPGRFFGEPAWTMMLELYIADSEGQPLTVTNLCAVSNGPQTTALRWISILEQEGFVKRFSSKEDRRIKKLCLTNYALESLDRYFALRRHQLV